MKSTAQDKTVVDKIVQLSRDTGIDIKGGKMRRTSSRFCLGVEHGDYNGTELFGVGTDRFIRLAYRANGTDRIKLFSGNFPDDGVVEFSLGSVPEPKSAAIADTWARFPYGVEYILRREGINLKQGLDGTIYGDIPGGGMSRSASLTLNLILSLLDTNGIEIEDKFKIVDMAQAVENDYIGSPCGQLDQIMILFAREDMGTYYNPKTRSINYVPLGAGAMDFRIVVLDTGTVRPGLEKSTYKIRRAECEKLVSILQKAGYDISCLADIKEQEIYEKIMAQFGQQQPDLCDRLKYIFGAQRRFYEMLDAWKAGDIETVGRIFREDGIGLRDDYKISGPELETMCDIARTVAGVLGERMLGGGDKGASGALVNADSVDVLKEAVDADYPTSHPEYKDKYAVHICKVVDGVKVYDGLLG
ncbi:MAG: galactokinase [Planctomycetota bacterium]|jgi:galactokinase